MTDNTENLVLENLRQLRNEIAGLRTETHEGFNRLDVRLGFVEQTLSGMLAVSASHRDELRALKQRIECIERRLELQDCWMLDNHASNAIRELATKADLEPMKSDLIKWPASY